MDASAELIADRTVLSRAARILDAFTGTRRVLSLTELTARSSLPKSTAHRLAGRLVALGWLEREPDGYQIGMRLFEAGRLSDRRIRLRETVLPHLQELAIRTRLSGTLAILAHEDAVCIEHVSGSTMRLPVHNGSRMSATRTTVGKALLAHQPAELVERIAAAEHPDWSAEGFELRALMADLRKVRETGFASFASTASSEPTCVATPLRVGQTVIGAIALSGPPAQFSINSVSQALRAAAQVIAGDYAAHTERAAALRQ